MTDHHGCLNELVLSGFLRLLFYNILGAPLSSLSHQGPSLRHDVLQLRVFGATLLRVHHLRLQGAVARGGTLTLFYLIRLLRIVRRFVLGFGRGVRRLDGLLVGVETGGDYLREHVRHRLPRRLYTPVGLRGVQDLGMVAGDTQVLPVRVYNGLDQAIPVSGLSSEVTSLLLLREAHYRFLFRIRGIVRDH